jgi:hypothetical protein
MNNLLSFLTLFLKDFWVVLMAQGSWTEVEFAARVFHICQEL